MKTRLTLVFLTLATVAAIVIASVQRPTAIWDFGKVQLTDLGEKGIGLYTSLHNRGAASREPVVLFALPLSMRVPLPFLVRPPEPLITPLLVKLPAPV